MDSLEFDLHALILDSLANVLSRQVTSTTKDELLRLVTRCPLLLPSDGLENGNAVGFMTKSYQQSISSLAVFAANTTSTTHLVEVLPHLLNHLKQLPAFSFEETLTWKDYSLPDELAGNLISELLIIAIRYPDKRNEIIDSVWAFIETLTELIKCRNEHICTVVLPLFNGCIRAIQTSNIAWDIQDFMALSKKTLDLIHNDSLSFINGEIDSLLQSVDPKEAYGKRLLAKYQFIDSPLSTNSLIFGLFTMKKNILSRITLVLTNNTNTNNSNDRDDEWVTMMNFPDVWNVLTGNPIVNTVTLEEDVKKALRATYIMALQYFTELTKLTENLQGKEYPIGMYAREIMAVCLNLAGLSSIYLQEIDDELTGKLTSSLFNVPHTPDVKVQTAALDVACLIALNFRHLTGRMIDTMRKFLTTSSTIFELAVVAFNDLTIQQYAIDRLACCLKASNEDVNSVIHAFYNVLITGEYERPPVSPVITPNVSNHSDEVSLDSTLSGFSRTEEQRYQISENIICSIVGIACILQNDKIINLVVSLLKQRLHTGTPSLDVLILDKLVEIALIGPERTFLDITEKFNVISIKLIFSQENKIITTAVLKCQLNLAKRISARPEFYGIYMTKILFLFVEKGVKIQDAVSEHGKVKVTALAAELGILLPVLKVLLAHDDFKVNPSEDLVAMFRNVWFYCVLYGFVSETTWVREWHDCLVAIAQKTPPLVLESATNYLSSDLQYNSVLRRGKSEQDLASLRSSLSAFLPNRAYEIRSFTFAEIVFLLSVYHIETMQSQLGKCSFVLRYFVNKGVNESKLVVCMEEIGDQAIKGFISECTRRTIAHTIDDNLRTQVRNLMIGACHRLEKVHRLSIKYLDQLITALPLILCDKRLLFLLLELIELVWQSCEAEYLNEYSPVYTFRSPKVGVTLEFPDTCNYRREMLSSLCENAKKWLTGAMSLAPLDIRGIIENYLAEFDPYQSVNPSHMGRSIALEIGKSFSKIDHRFGTLPRIPGVIVDNLSDFISDYSSRRHYRGSLQHWIEVDALKVKDSEDSHSPTKNLEGILEQLKQQLALLEKRVLAGTHFSLKEVNNTLHLAAAILIASSKVDDIIQYVVWIPVYIFKPESIKLATQIWNWIITEKPEIEKRIMVEIVNSWIWALRHRMGLFSGALDVKAPFVNKMLYAPSDKESRDKTYQLANYLFGSHITWIQFLSSRFQAVRYRSPEIVNLYLRLFQITLDYCDSMSNHSLSREARFEILLLGFKVLQSNHMEALIEYQFRSRLYRAAFAWFSLSPKWSYGGNKRATLTDYKLLQEVYRVVDIDKVEMDEILSSVPKKNSQAALANGSPVFIADKTREDIIKQAAQSKKLLLLFLKSELGRLATWSNPLNATDQIKEMLVDKTLTDDGWKQLIRHAWDISPQLAVQLTARFQQPVVQNELHTLIANNTAEAVGVVEALPLLLGEKLAQNVVPRLKYLLYWAPVPPITAITYFSPSYNYNPLVLQYAMRALEYHPVDVVFFYIPQIVQALRHDKLGYVERFIMNAAQISQLFAHQIIWNMKANMFKDEESSIPDTLKPTLDRIIDNIVDSLSGKDKEFFEREFTFFNNVTSISGKLKPYIKKSKEEKKQKIDEEMKKIKVDIGVYLPSNPEGIVIGIDYKSGRPLQSHAKAPFMATFKIRKTKNDSDEIKEVLVARADTEGLPRKEKTIDVWQSAIFKVGDDCRQDVLALQLIAIFKNIFTSVGLDLYLFPYRIVATAPGCGVIDVIPKSISRDQLGREKVNSLYDYFLTRYGGLDSIEFQKARNCFIQSVAAYSVVSYLLQFKDRHNGNIMLDDAGHIIHIDFGYILEIAPGGITFESSPFKLTTEMIQVMGGSADVQPFKWFSELCIKAYLASRSYAEQIIQCVALMLGSGLPCFKGERTLKNLRTRFQLDKTERGAADFMIERINQSFENRRTVWYDSFQKATNGIPY
ncbi:5515_t:CDS:10 [Ambispora gerdemannii]|uniref:1-phosphatidylinositol 4-kinase n=1 Tax=Ambispora gerdemannii TaxID=144530 RepID=A0A9N9A1X9_9GLOM|nr:5515_t:CDS:10 [Ambispora gerdemannii]